MANNLPDLSRHATWIADQVGTILDQVNRFLHADRFNQIINGTTLAGHWALLALAVLGLIIQLVAAFAIEWSQILWGLGWLVVLPLLQYTAVQFLGASRSLVLSNTTALGSEAFLRSVALVVLVAAVVALISGIGLAFQLGSLTPFLTGLAAAVLWLATGWLALNPELLGIRVSKQSSAGDEAIGILSFFIKSMVRIVPVFYGVALVVGVIQALIILLGMIGSGQHEIARAILGAQALAPAMIYAVISPFLAYIAFVVYFLIIDVLRSILAIPNSNLGSKRGSQTSGSGAGKKKKKKKTS